MSLADTFNLLSPSLNKMNFPPRFVVDLFFDISNAVSFMSAGLGVDSSDGRQSLFLGSIGGWLSSHGSWRTSFDQTGDDGHDQAGVVECLAILKDAFERSRRSKVKVLDLMEDSRN
jgi:hypothetical protein